jgi:hypothetical protein
LLGLLVELIDPPADRFGVALKLVIAADRPAFGWVFNNLNFYFFFYRV